MSGELAHQHAIVIGASSGIGREIALRLAAGGARVLVAARREEQASEVVREIIAQGGCGYFHFVDVTETASVVQLLDMAVDRHGPVNVAVNNAGIEGTPFVPTADYDEAVFDAVIDTNLKGVWRCMRAEIPHMATGGVIINMSSIAGLGANEMMGCAYTASKHGIIGLTKTAAREYAPQGIRINALCPGVITTDIAERSFLSDAAVARKVLKMHPLGRFGTTAEVADAALFLASSQSSFMTGHALVLDGGASC